MTPNANDIAAHRTPELRIERIAKRFSLRTIFESLSATVQRGQTLAITGRNGSGKSTFLKIAANVLQPSEGSVAHLIDGAALDAADLTAHIGFVAPYLQLYTEFTAWEHLELLQGMRGLPFDAEHALELFETFGLAGRRNEPIATFSSGMIQRVRFIVAMVHRPAFLFLDEPGSNLDAHGAATMRDLVRRTGNDRVTVIATNDEDDVTMATSVISVEDPAAR